MAVKTENGVTTLTPTAWKWFAGAAAAFLFFPGFGFFIAVFFVLMGAGVLQRVSLSPSGLKVRNWWSEKSYAWDQIGDFRTRKIKSGLITAANMVSFTHVNKEGTTMGKAAKFLAGGTHSIPAVGISAQKLGLLMQAYKAGHIPADTPEGAVQSPMPTPLPAAQKAAQVARPRAVPATPSASDLKPAANRAPARVRQKATPLVQDGGGLFGRRRPSSPFGS
nr:hypothetical protein [Hyphomonas sp. Mor2]